MAIADPDPSASRTAQPKAPSAGRAGPLGHGLTLIRHAKSSWKRAELPDHDRPLKGRGRRDVARMAARLRERGFAPDVILTSTAERARATAAAIAEACGLEGRVETSRSLYHADPMQILESIERHRARAGGAWTHVAVVGHNPGSSELLEWLTHAGVGDLPTCAVATVDLPRGSFALGEIREGEARLVRLETPKDEKDEKDEKRGKPAARGRSGEGA